jgi:hypothetical protein
MSAEVTATKPYAGKLVKSIQDKAVVRHGYMLMKLAGFQGPETESFR